ncbi:MAG: VanZ family protein [Candidatus Brocadiales bacterium]
MVRKIISSKVFKWFTVSLYAGLIFLGSSMSAESKESVGGLSINKHLISACAHLIEYGILSILLCWAISAHLKVNQIRKLVFMAVIIASLYGITDEVHQLFVPTRMGTISDWLTDTVGAAIASLCWLKIFPAWKRRGES